MIGAEVVLRPVGNVVTGSMPVEKDCSYGVMLTL